MFVVTLAMVLALPATGQTVETHTRQMSPAEALRELQAAKDEIVGDIPAERRPLITRVKHDMRDLIVATLKEEKTPGKKPDAVRAAILRRFRRAGLKQVKDDYGCYARFFKVEVKAPRGHPDLLAVRLAVEIPWGDDNSLYLFERWKSDWTPVLEAEVNDYPSVYEAQSRFRYRISPTALDGNWFVVTGSINLHAASAWQHITYTAQAPGPEPEHPKMLVHKRHGIYLLGYENETLSYDLKMTTDGFQIAFQTDVIDPPDVPCCGHILWSTYSYRVADGAAKQLPTRCRIDGRAGMAHRCAVEDDEPDQASGEKTSLPFTIEVKNMVGASGPVTVEVTPGGESDPETELLVPSKACLRGAASSACFETVADRKFGKPTTAEVLDIGDGRSGLMLIATVNGVTGSMRMVAVLGLNADGRLTNLLPFVYVSEKDQFLYWHGAGNSAYGILTVANTIWDLDHETRFDDHRYQISSYEFCPSSKRFVLTDRFNTRHKHAMETDENPGELVLKATMRQVKVRLRSKRLPRNCEKA